MKKILILLLITFSHFAMAEWSLFSEGKKDDGAIFRSYIDSDRVEKVEDEIYKKSYLSAWVAVDFSKAQNKAKGVKPYKSVYTRYAIDCEKKQFQVIATALYTGNLKAQGDNLYSKNYQISNIDWEPPIPNSIGEQIIRLVCNAKAEQSISTKEALPPSIDVTSWRSLKKGFTEAEVKTLLGEPKRIEGGSFTYWHYANNGSVTFYKDTVYSWREPY